MKLPATFTLQMLVDICGVLGFLLSVILAAAQFLRQRVRLSARAAYILKDANETIQFITLRLVICNRSSQDLGICSVDLRCNRKWLASGFVPERILSHQNNKTLQRFDLTSTQFPISIPAYEAQEAVLVYRAQCTQSSRFRSLHPGKRRQWESLRIRIHTVRGTRVVRCRAAAETVEELLDVVRRNNRF